MFNIKNLFNRANNNTDQQPLIINENKLHTGSVLPRQTQIDSPMALFQGKVTPYKVAEYKF